MHINRSRNTKLEVETQKSKSKYFKSMSKYKNRSQNIFKSKSKYLKQSRNIEVVARG